MCGRKFNLELLVQNAFQYFYYIPVYIFMHFVSMVYSVILVVFIPIWVTPTHEFQGFVEAHMYAASLRAGYFVFATLISMLSLCCIVSTFVFIHEKKYQYLIYFVTGVLSFFSSALLLLVLSFNLIVLQDTIGSKGGMYNVSGFRSFYYLLYGYWCNHIISLFLSSNFIQLYSLDTWQELWCPIPNTTNGSKSQLVPLTASSIISQISTTRDMTESRPNEGLRHAVTSLPNASVPACTPLIDTVELPKVRRLSFQN